MIDINKLLRNRNIFGTGGSPMPKVDPYKKLSFSGQEQEPLPSRKLASDYNMGSGGTEEESLVGKFSRFASEPEPNIQDYKPGKMQRLTAALRGISTADPMAAREVLTQPFDEDVKRRERRARILGTGANLEINAGNADFNRYAKDKQLGINERNVASLEKNRTSLADTRTAKQQLAEWKAKNPNLVIKASKGGNFVGIDPIDGSAIDTGISTGTSTEADLQELRASGVLEAIKTRTAGQKEIEGVKASNAANLEGVKHDNRMTLQQLKNDAPGAKMVFQPGGNILVMHKNGTIEDTGLDSGKVSDKEKQEFNIALINARGQQSRETKQTPGPNTTKTLESVKDEDGNEVTRKLTTTGSKPGSSNTAGQKVLIDPEGKKRDVSAWSSNDIEQAKKNGWKVP